jgi:amino acid transporter
MLINYIMGSRLLYGMARHGLLPSVLARVHPVRRTPHIAIGLLLMLIVLLAFAGNVSALAQATALLLLFSFAVVNTSLVVLKLRPSEPAGGFEVPIVIPMIGVIINLTLIVARLTAPSADPRAPYISGAILLVVSVLFFIMRPKEITEESLAAVEQET